MKTGRADIVLVSADHVKPTLLLAEVKWWAKPNAPRNPTFPKSYATGRRAPTRRAQLDR